MRRWPVGFMVALCILGTGLRAQAPTPAPQRPAAEVATPAPERSGARESTPMADPVSPREHHRLGQLEKRKQARRAHFKAGIAAAQALLQRDPDDPEGLLWLAANLGSEALARGKLSALGTLPKMERHLLRLDAVDPGHDGAAASRVLGELYRSAPALISIGSNKKARAAFEKALRLAPQHPGNQALAARFFREEGPKPRALELARQVLQNPDLESYPSAAEWRQIAEDIVKRSER